MSNSHGEMITHTQDNDTLQTFVMRVSVAPHRGEQQKIQLYHTRFCRGFASNKIGMFLLQILNKTDTAPVVAIAAAYARPVRVETEAGRVVARVLSGKPIVAATLHAADI